jgi:hypothetical protein
MDIVELLCPRNGRNAIGSMTFLAITGIFISILNILFMLPR